MDVALFLRAANVGGHNVMRNADVVKRLSEEGIEAASHGASGNFLIWNVSTEARAAALLAAVLPFKTVIVTRTSEILDSLIRSTPFAGKPSGSFIKWQVSLLERRPRVEQQIPLLSPKGKEWRVELFGLRGEDLCSLYRVVEGKPFDINRFVEAQFKVAATTRTWNTVVAISDALAGE